MATKPGEYHRNMDKQIVQSLKSLHTKFDKLLTKSSPPALIKRVKKVEDKLMALTPEVQKLIDDVTANKDGVDAALAGLAAEGTQITDLTTRVADLEAQLAAGGTIGAEDLAAIQSGLAVLEETNTKLQTAVPAGVSAKR